MTTMIKCSGSYRYSVYDKELHTDFLFGCSIHVSAMMAKKKNPLVFFDISIDGGRAEKMVFEVQFLIITCMISIVLILQRLLL